MKVRLLNQSRDEDASGRSRTNSLEKQLSVQPRPGPALSKKEHDDADFCKYRPGIHGPKPTGYGPEKDEKSRTSSDQLLLKRSVDP